jgi:hypothetical protein
MNKPIFLGLIVLLLGGCSESLVEQFSPPTPSPTPEGIPQSLPPPSSTSCPEKPGQLLPENIESLSFAGDRTNFTTSGEVTADRQLGYTFTPRSGSQLRYQVNNDKVCVWLYDPALKLMNAGQIQSTDTQSFDLTENSQYTLQVSALKGKQEFELGMVVMMPLSENEAAELVAEWLGAKSKIFARPYDISLVGKLTTGKRYEEIQGSIQWLKDYNAEYKFSSQSVKKTGKFSSNLDEATIEVIVSEDRTLHINGKLDYNHTTFGVQTSRDRFDFRRREDGWKIISYESLN